MALELNMNDGIINVIGELCSQNASTLKQHFESFLNDVDNIILNLDNVTYIEPSGTYTIEQLYLDFIKSNRIIRIIGRENQGLIAAMIDTKTAYVLSADRV